MTGGCAIRASTKGWIAGRALVRGQIALQALAGSWLAPPAPISHDAEYNGAALRSVTAVTQRGLFGRPPIDQAIAQQNHRLAKVVEKADFQAKRNIIAFGGSENRPRAATFSKIVILFYFSMT